MKKDHDIINENQRRAIGVTLVLLDEMLCRFDEWVRGRELRSVLYEESNSLSDAQRAALQAEASRMRSIMADLRDRLHLTREICSAANDIWARTAAFVENIMELEDKGLRGYGDVHPDVERLMAETMPLLLDGLDRIMASVGSSHNE